MSGHAIAGLISIAIIISIASLWRVFTKAGKPGWAAIVPFYNAWVLAEISSNPGWWGLVAALGIFINQTSKASAVDQLISILCLVLYALIVLGIAKNFKKSTPFAVLLVLLPFIGYPILAYGSSTYKKPKSTTTQKKTVAK